MLNNDSGNLSCFYHKYDVPVYDVYYKFEFIESFYSYGDALKYCIDHYLNDLNSCEIFLSIRFDFQGGLEDVFGCSE